MRLLREFRGGDFQLGAGQSALTLGFDIFPLRGNWLAAYQFPI